MSDCIPSINKPNPTHGYALRRIDGKRVYEHTFAWEEVNGPVPIGMVLDHICHDPALCHLGKDCPHRACRNPEHMVVTTRGQNAIRGFSAQGAKTHCPQKHPYSKENTRVWTDSEGGEHRVCRTCAGNHIRAFKQRAKGLS